MGNFLNSSDSVFHRIETDKKINLLSNELKNITTQTNEKILQLSDELKDEIDKNKPILYNEMGSNEDGAMTQAAVTNLINETNTNFNTALGDIGSILDEINRTEV